MNKNILLFGLVFILLSSFITATDFTQNNVLWLDVNESDSTIIDYSGTATSITNNGVSVQSSRPR